MNKLQQAMANQEQAKILECLDVLDNQVRMPLTISVAQAIAERLNQANNAAQRLVAIIESS